jgi:hypothetical protein
MNFLPCLAKFFQAVFYTRLNAPKFAPRESVILPKLRWACRTVQIENGLASIPDDMDVRWPVIIRIHNHPKPAKSQD